MSPRAQALWFVAALMLLGAASGILYGLIGQGHA